MPAQTTNLFLLEDLEDVGRTSELAESDREALQAVAEWIKSSWSSLTRISVALGPSVPLCLGHWNARHFGWLRNRSPSGTGPQVVELMSGYKRLLLDTRPTEGDDVIYNVIVVVFADLSADRAQGVFDDVLKQLAVPSYVQDGIVFGPFYEGNERTAIYNAGSRPFQSPVPFLFVRHGVISDWKFFLDNGDWLNLWGRRFGESAVHALAEELRRSRGGWGATNPKVASRRKEHLIPPTCGPEGTLAGVARWVGRNRDLVPGARSSTRVMPVPNHPAASACTLKFSRVYSHRTIAGGIGHNLPQEAPEAFADAVLQAGGRGT